MRLVQPAVLLFHALADEKVVLGLLDDGSHETESVGDAPGIGDFAGGPLGCSPVEGLTVVDEVVESAHDLLHGGIAVGTMSVDDVYVWQVQTLEREVHALDDVFP